MSGSVLVIHQSSEREIARLELTKCAGNRYQPRSVPHEREMKCKRREYGRGDYCALQTYKRGVGHGQGVRKGRLVETSPELRFEG